MKFCFWTTLCCVIFIISPSISAETPLFFGVESSVPSKTTGIDTQRLLEFLHRHEDVNSAEIQTVKRRIGLISKNIIQQIKDNNKYSHYSSEEYVTLPNDLLLLVISIEEAEIHKIEVTSNKKLHTIIVPVVAMSLQLADPKSGQTIYSDFEIVEGYEDLKKNPIQFILPEEEDLIKRKDRAIWWSLDKNLNVPIMFCDITTLLSNKLMHKFLTNFNSSPTKAKVANILSKKTGQEEILINKGRSAGFFKNSRLSSIDGKFVFQVTESFDTYSIARLLKGNVDNLKKWSTVLGFQAASGSGNTLTSVSRIIFSPDVLSETKLSRLAEDENELNKSLNEHDSGSPIYQSMLAARLTELLTKTNRFRITYPTSGLRAIKIAKVNMQSALHLKIEKGDPFFDESLVIPDQVVTGIISAPSISSRPLEEGDNEGGGLNWIPGLGGSDKAINENRKSIATRIMGSLHLYDLNSEAIIASGHGLGLQNATEDFLPNGDPSWVPISWTDQLLRHCVLGKQNVMDSMGTTEGVFFPSALEELILNYKSVTSIGKVSSDSTDNELIITNSKSMKFHNNATVEVFVMRGKLPLSENTSKNVDILTKVGIGIINRKPNGDWFVHDIKWDSDLRPSAGDDFEFSIICYGLNSLQNDPYGFGNINLTSVVHRGVSMSAEDASGMLLATVSSYPDLTINLPQFYKNKLDAFNKAKYLSDYSFRDPSTLESVFEGSESTYENTLELELVSLHSAVLNRSIGEREKEVDRNCEMTLHFYGKDNKNLCKPGTLKHVGVKIHSITAYEGDAYGKVWVQDLLPRLFKMFKSNRMLGSQHDN